MLQLVNAGHKSLADYASITARGLMDEIRRGDKKLTVPVKLVERPSAPSSRC